MMFFEVQYEEVRQCGGGCVWQRTRLPRCGV